MAALGRGGVARWAALFMAANVATKGAYVLLVIWLATVLSPQSYADFGIIYALQSGVATLALTGLFETAVGRLRNRAAPRRRQALFRRISGLFLMTSFLCGLTILPFLAVIAPRHGLAPAVAAALIIGIAIGYSTLQAGLLRLDGRHGSSLIVSVTVPLFGVSSLALGVLAAHSLVFAFGLGAAGSVGALILLQASNKVYIGPFPRSRNIPREAAALFPYLIIGILGWVSGYGMNFFIDLLYSQKDVADYTLLFTISSLNQLVVSSVNMVIAPRFYAKFNAGFRKEADLEVGKGFRVLALGLGAIGFATVGALPWLSEIVATNLSHYADKRLELGLLLSGYIFCLPWWRGQNYYFVANRGRELMSISVWAGVAGLLLWMACAAALGPVGIYLGFALQMAVKSIYMAGVARKHWQIGSLSMSVLLGSGFIFLALFLPKPL